MNLVLLALLLLLPRTIGAEETTPPEPPAGQVLDHSGWLDASSARRLEAELGRLRHEHQVDVCVVIWDQSLPGDLDHESFARQLGSTWARENLWAVVLKEPGSDTPPAVAYSGSPLDRPGADAAVPAIETAIAQGLQDWSDRARTSSVALNLGEELVLLRTRQVHADRSSTPHPGDPALATRQEDGARAIKLSLGVAAAILLIGVFLTIRVVRGRGPAELVFPDTRWRRRLGASWCGGSDLVTTFTPPDPR